MFDSLVLAARDEEEIDDFRDYDEEAEGGSKLDDVGDDEDDEEDDSSKRSHGAQAAFAPPARFREGARRRKTASCQRARRG